MRTVRRTVLLAAALLCLALGVHAQGFVNLSASQVRVGERLPVYSQELPLGRHYADSLYEVTIEYPEFIDMSRQEASRCQALCPDTLPALPVIDQFVGVSRRQGTLYVQFVPIVFRDGRYQKMVSFKLKVKSTPNPSRTVKGGGVTRAGDEAQVAGSVLATGQWAKISVAETGVYQLTDALIRQCGFSDPQRVKIYGYGGALQPETLDADYLQQTDDLREVPTCTVGGRRLFHAVGPVTWANATTTQRTRNPYSDVGCYFLTQNDDGEPLSVDSATFVGSFYPSADDYHSLSEVDDYAWYHSGRNLYQSTPVPSDGYLTAELPAHTDSGVLALVLSYDGKAQLSVEVNDSVVGNIDLNVTLSDYTTAAGRNVQYTLKGMLKANNSVRIRQLSGDATVRLDYVSLTMATPKAAPQLSSDRFSAPQYMYHITNQNHHADPQADMVIIIPTTQKVLSQAQRLKQLHEERDSLRVNIVPADELYNEFSSGTPDANAYRRYLKMLYDRADSEADMPRYLLLFGDAAWDNRMLSSNWRRFTPDDFLLCYQSENSFSETDSYITDDFFCMLDDGEGSRLTREDKTDVGVGRLTARTEEEARIMVDKIVGYAQGDYAGDWQNTICFMGDDGNNNTHMREAEAAVQTVLGDHPAYSIRRVYWDAYQRTTSSTGYRYPDVERMVKQQMKAGALIMDYCGHGRADQVSHEHVLTRSDFAEQTSLRLPLWITASCDIMPFDSHEDNIGETAMLNARGGAVAFFGTTRTVYTGDNQNVNCAFLEHVLGSTDGRRNRLGDAVRLAKNAVRSLPTQRPAGDSGPTDHYAINKLHYSLLGDPALTLAAPTMRVVIDSINGQPAGQGNISIGTGERVSVAGHVEGASFSGLAALTVKDIETQVVCRMNNDDTSTPFVYNDRPTVVFNGQDSLRNGRFNLTFVLPQDISYSEACGQMTVYALSNDRQHRAHGVTEDFTMGNGNATVPDDGVGPSIYCYLNSSDFQNGGSVNTTPYFYAQLTDKDGINAAGSSLGHDLELVVDGQQSMTYNLNEYFQYDFGNYQSGTVGFSLPELAEGDHRLTFRAWDVMNNSSVAELRFTVLRALRPNCFSVECTRNPASTSTSFIINHDRTGSLMDITLEVFDTSGRLLWAKTETGASTDSTYTLDWDLTTAGGSRLQTGVYLYRVLISSDGSKRASQAQKLIILGQH